MKSIIDIIDSVDYNSFILKMKRIRVESKGFACGHGHWVIVKSNI